MSQPVDVYPTPFPNPVTQRPAASHHSNESFGTVFIVLAVIVIISAIACILGRVCNKRHNRPKDEHNQAPFRSKKEKEAKQNHASQPRDGDIEFGFDKRFSSAKVSANEDFRGGPKAFQNGAARGDGGIEFGFDKRFPSGKGAANEEFRGPKAFHNGKSKRELRFADDAELKPGA